MIVLVECLLVSHEVARAFLTNHRAPSSSDSTLVPFVVKQETESLKCALEILLELYVDKSSMKANDAEMTEVKLLNVLDNVLTYFLGRVTHSSSRGGDRCRFLHQKCWCISIPPSTLMTLAIF